MSTDRDNQGLGMPGAEGRGLTPAEAMAPDAGSTGLEDLPVSVCLREPLAGEVRSWVEGELRWQLVPPEGPPRPALVMREATDVRPGCVVVTAGEVDAADLRRALDEGAQDALGWPGDRGRLPRIVRRQLPEPAGHGPAVYRVAGTGGGVGTSTVALALAGLAGWAGRSVAVIGDDDLLGLCGLGRWQGPGLAEVLTLGPADGPAELEGLVRPVAGVDRLVVLGGGVHEPLQLAGWPYDLVVADLGVVGATSSNLGVPDLLVTSADARAAVAEGVGAPLVVVGDGPLDSRGVRSLAGRRPVGWLPASARVGRAGIAGRVPAALPGTWLRALRETLARVRPS